MNINIVHWFLFVCFPFFSLGFVVFNLILVRLEFYYYWYLSCLAWYLPPSSFFATLLPIVPRGIRNSLFALHLLFQSEQLITAFSTSSRTSTACGMSTTKFLMKEKKSDRLLLGMLKNRIGVSGTSFDVAQVVLRRFKMEFPSKSREDEGQWYPWVIHPLPPL